MHEETRVNLHSVMRDQAYAHAVFWTSAQHSRNDVAVAVLFERAARARLEDHFAQLAQLADPTMRIADLLADAIRLDAEQDYREFIAQANDVGDTEVAEALSAIQSFRDAELEALQAARMRHQLTTSPAPTATAQEEPAPTADLPPVAAIATTPIPDSSPVEPPEPAAPPHEPAQPLVDEAPPDEPESDSAHAETEQDVEDSVERVVVRDSEERVVVTLETPVADEVEADEPSPLEEPAMQEAEDEYRVIYIDKRTKKTEEGARELETRLSTLAQDGWSLTTTIGSQLILHRTRT